MLNKMNVQKDLKFGLLKEQQLEKTSQYSAFDFYNEDTMIELKSRRNHYSKYPTTIITENKLIFARKNPGCNYIFVFAFTDGIYYHKFDENHEYDIRDAQNFADQGKPRRHAFIPIEDLIKI